MHLNIWTELCIMIAILAANGLIYEKALMPYMSLGYGDIDRFDIDYIQIKIDYRLWGSWRAHLI